MRPSSLSTNCLLPGGHLQDSGTIYSYSYPPLMMPLSKHGPRISYPEHKQAESAKRPSSGKSVNATRRLGTLRRAPSVPHAGSTAIVSNPVRLDGYKKLEGENQGNRTAAGGPMDPRRPSAVLGRSSILQLVFV
ncbi:hypothetical protein V8C40DRAFT_233404 [Trichoderma camerunense]